MWKDTERMIFVDAGTKNVTATKGAHYLVKVL
jgi:hypothetical protein